MIEAVYVFFFESIYRPRQTDMGFKGKRIDMGQFLCVSFFNIDTLAFILNNGMPQISKKIKIDISMRFDLIIYIVEQFLKCSVLIHEVTHSFVQEVFHFEPVPPFVVLNLFYVSDDLTVFYNKRSCVIAPNAVVLRA